MCEPTTLAAAVIGTSALQAYGQYTDGKFQASVANQNAKINEDAALDAINKGNAQAQEQRRRTRQLAGTQAATMSASGIDLSTAGALDILGDTAAMGELDALTMVNNASREAYGYRMQAENDRLNAKMARRSGNMGAMTTLLTAPIQAYGAYQLAGGTWSPFGSGGSGAAKAGKTFAKAPKGF